MGILKTVVLLWAAVGGKHPTHAHTHTPQGVNGRAERGNDGTNSEGLLVNARHTGGGEHLWRTSASAAVGGFLENTHTDQMCV